MDPTVWLEEKLEELPAELAEAVRAVVARAPSGADGAGTRLAQAALQEFDATAVAGPARATALRLLAADAVLTYAFEAAAELGEDVLTLASSFGPRGQIGERLRDASIQDE